MIFKRICFDFMWKKNKVKKKFEYEMKLEILLRDVRKTIYDKE